MINRKLRNTMLITAIIGVMATIAFAIFFDVENMDSWKILLLPALFYAFGYLIIGYGFRWKFGGETRWICTLYFSPCMFEVFGFLFIDYLLSEEIAICFIEWFTMIGVTISVLIFEYKFATHDKK